MADNWGGKDTAIDGPAANGAAVTPSDSVDLANASRGLWIGGAGDVSVNFAGSGSSVVIAGVPAGTLLPLRVARVRATGTTATSIVALF